ncbi:MAG TPA: hypothetical protein VGR70_21015 [Stellaceae bacterium]|nr:hypothetical protein [Stellaceae bacterium]
MRDNNSFDLMIRSENIIRRHWRDLTPADRKDLDDLVSNDVDDAADGADHGKWLVVRGSLDAVIRQTSD